MCSHKSTVTLGLEAFILRSGAGWKKRSSWRRWWPRSLARRTCRTRTSQTLLAQSRASAPPWLPRSMKTRWPKRWRSGEKSHSRCLQQPHCWRKIPPTSATELCRQQWPNFRPPRMRAKPWLVGLKEGNSGKLGSTRTQALEAAPAPVACQPWSSGASWTGGGHKVRHGPDQTFGRDIPGFMPRFPGVLEEFETSFWRNKSRKKKSCEGIWWSECPGSVPGKSSERPREKFGTSQDTRDVWADLCGNSNSKGRMSAGQTGHMTGQMGCPWDRRDTDQGVSRQNFLCLLFFFHSPISGHYSRDWSESVNVIEAIREPFGRDFRYWIPLGTNDYLPNLYSWRIKIR